LKTKTRLFSAGAIDYAPKPLNALQALAGQAWAKTEEALNIQATLQTMDLPAIWIGAQPNSALATLHACLPYCMPARLPALPPLWISKRE